MDSLLEGPSAADRPLFQFQGPEFLSDALGLRAVWGMLKKRYG